MAASTPRFRAPTVEVLTEDSSPALSKLLDTFSPRARKLSKIGIAEVCRSVMLCICFYRLPKLLCSERPLAVLPCRFCFDRVRATLHARTEAISFTADASGLLTACRDVLHTWLGLLSFTAKSA